MSIAGVRSDISKLAASIRFDVVGVPAHLASMPVMDAIHAKLTEHVAKFGGYALLSRALPSHSTKVWQAKIERCGRNRLHLDDFMGLLDLFRDPLLLALMAHKLGLEIVDLTAVPESEYSPADLRWALSSLSAEGALAVAACIQKCSDLHSAAFSTRINCD